MGNAFSQCGPEGQAQKQAQATEKPYASFRQVAVGAVVRAARATTKIQASLQAEDTVMKKDASPVTLADFAAQIIIINDLHKAFPDVPVIAEEASKDVSDDIRERLMEVLPEFVEGITPERLAELLDAGRSEVGESPFWWTLDPVDGTQGFLRREQYCIALALMDKNKPVVGVMGCPALPTKMMEPETVGCLMAAVKDQGCFMMSLGEDGESVCVVQEGAEQAGIICTESPNASHSSPHIERIMKELDIKKSSIKIDSQCKYVLVARGEATMYLRYSGVRYKEKVWDHAAGVICVQEAGGRVTDIEGNDLDFSKGRALVENTGIVATNGAIHAQVLEAVKAVDPVGQDTKK